MRFDLDTPPPPRNRATRRAQARAERRAPKPAPLRRVVRNATQLTMARHQDARPEAVTGLLLELHECLDALQRGSADTELFERLACSMNTALVLAERIGAVAVDVMLAAQAAMLDCRARFERLGRFGFTGPGLQAMADALALYRQIVQLSTPRQIIAAADEAHRRVIAQMREQLGSGQACNTSLGQEAS
ncbi:MAG: hypothetical protein JSR68_08445 [Proteobacteria bacterium]|nr:hypothetical protein [Pseudomonadota bacterium]